MAAANRLRQGIAEDKLITTYEEAMQRAGKTLAEAAERAFTAGGPGLDELEERIIRFRYRASVEAGGDT